MRSVQATNYCALLHKVDRDYKVTRSRSIEHNVGALDIYHISWTIHVDWVRVWASPYTSAPGGVVILRHLFSFVRGCRNTWPVSERTPVASPDHVSANPFIPNPSYIAGMILHSLLTEPYSTTSWCIIYTLKFYIKMLSFIIICKTGVCKPPIILLSE